MSITLPLRPGTRVPSIALVGNPNTGKTTLFNVLCRTRRRTANYPGVTVERHTGLLRLPGGEAELVDLPGTYSLKADSFDEQVVVDSLLGRVAGLPRPDLVILVLDASNLTRNLYLYTQLAELDLPIVIALTMSDTLSENGISLDPAALEEALGVPVIDVSGERADGVARLSAALDGALRETPSASRRRTSRPEFPSVLEQIAGEFRAEAGVLDGVALTQLEARTLVLENSPSLEALLHGDQRVVVALGAARKKASNAGVAAPAVVAAARYRWISAIVSAVEHREHRAPSRSLRIDAVLTHRLWGPPIFASIMYVVFASIYAWAKPAMDAIDAAFRFGSDRAQAALSGLPMLQSLVGDGIIGGVGAVVIFLPQIVFLFLFISLLEDSGYLARAALMMDRLLAWSGLNGRAFIPMLSSFACAVPGVMSARVMADPRARLATILTAPLMSCSARLPVYVLMIGAFIEPVVGPLAAGLTLFLMHGVGVVIALPVAFVLNRGVLRTPTVPFVLELPPYRRPHLRSTYYRVRDAAAKFLVRSGTIIFALSIVVWAMTYFPRPESVRVAIEHRYAPGIAAARTSGDSAVQLLTRERDRRISAAFLEQSYLGRAGRTVQPLFAPLGYDWKITVGILGAFPAREVIIATLGIIYSVGDADEHSSDLRETMRKEKRPDGTAVFTPLTAISIMVFFALCCQCLSTVVTVQRETRSWGWAAFLFTYMTVLAYLVSAAVYQGGRWLGFS